MSERVTPDLEYEWLRHQERVEVKAEMGPLDDDMADAEDAQALADALIDEFTETNRKLGLS
jgi:hypothetical protein